MFKVEEATSARATCKLSGEKIEKGELRVGTETYVHGSETPSQQWHKLMPFLSACLVEHSPNNRASCRKTSVPFKKGDLRFASPAGKGKLYLTFAAAAEELPPVLRAADGKFQVSDIKGLDTLTAEEQQAFVAAFEAQGVSVGPLPEPALVSAIQAAPAKEKVKRKPRAKPAEGEGGEGEGEEGAPKKRQKREPKAKAPGKKAAGKGKKKAEEEEEEEDEGEEEVGEHAGGDDCAGAGEQGEDNGEDGF